MPDLKHVAGRADVEKTVLFGCGNFASLAWYCLTHDSGKSVTGFTVDKAHLSASELHGVPIFAFEELESVLEPAEHALLFPLGPHNMNRVRMARFEAAKNRGYAISNYVSSRSIVWPDLVVGEGVLIFEGTVVQPFAKIGVDTIVRSSVHISHHVTVGDHCFIAAGACIGGGAVVEDRCFIGLNATVRDGVRIAEGCLIAAGASVMADTRPDGLYVGSPARRAPAAPSV